MPKSPKARTTVVSQVEEDIEPELLAFMREAVNSFVKWDLIRFFHNNPHAAEAAVNIAQDIGREAEVVEAELLELVEAQLLEVSLMSKVRIFALVDDEHTRGLVERFVKACDDPQFRVKAIDHLINGKL